MNEAMTWLRRQIEHDKTVAEAARHGTDGRWWRCIRSEAWDERAGEPCGALYAGEPSYDVDGDMIGGSRIVVYDEGHPGHEEFAHIAAQDPRHTIARGEAELAILDEHGPLPEDGSVARCRVCWSDSFSAPRDPYPCRTMHLVARGYRHREGYAQHWGSS